MEKYTPIRKIANALYGDVIHCQQKHSKKNVVIKRLQLTYALRHRTIADGIEIPEDAMNELKVNRVVQRAPVSRYLVDMVEEIQEQNMLCMVLTYCAKGDLYGIVSEEQNLSKSVVLYYFRQITFGLRDLHHLGFAHRDVSLENIFVTETNECKLGDFGLAVPLNMKCSTSVGKQFYLAPEVFSGKSYYPEYADVWSLGIILFILHTGIPLFESPCMEDARYAFFCKNGLRALLHQWNLNIPSMAIHLLEQLLQIQPFMRMPMHLIVRHPYVRASSSVCTTCAES